MAGDPDRLRCEPAASAGGSERTGDGLLSRKLAELSDAMLAFDAFPPGTIDFHEVAKRLCELVDGIGAVANSIDPVTESPRTEALYVRDPGFLSNSARLLGFDPVGRVWQIDAETRRELWQDQVVTLDGVHGLMFGHVPRFICSQLERLAGVGKIYAIGLTYRGRIVGGAAFGLPRGRELELPGIVEVFGRMVGTLLTRREAERAVTAERDRLRASVAGIRDAIVIVDPDGAVSQMNPAAERLLGFGETAARGKRLGELLRFEPPAGGEDWLASFPATEGPPRRATLLGAAGPVSTITVGSRLPADPAAHAGGVLVVRDVSEDERVERELRRAERLESLGVLAGGIAHDFNNQLAAILANIELARTSFTDRHELEDVLHQAELAAGKAQRLTRQLLTFARGGAPVLSPERLPDIVRDTVELLLRGTSVTVELRFPHDLWSVAADAGQLGQVVQNLVVNAIEAFGGSQGRLEIAAENTTLAGGGALEPGAYVRLTFKDDGPGIPAGILPKIFDPFFTTKARGSGLGLSTAYSIVRRHGGTLEVNSRVGEGAAFSLTLPAARMRPRATGGEPPVVARGLGRILVMDDEDALRSTFARMLRRLGYDSETAADGEAAVRRYEEARRSGVPFSAVILDLTVPGGNGGKWTLERLRALDPDVRAIVTSGYADEPVMASYREHGFTASLAKPFKMDELARRLDETLAGAPAAG